MKKIIALFFFLSIVTQAFAGDKVSFLKNSLQLKTDIN